MAPAIVHFTAGFVTVLAVLWVVPITRYRLTGAFLGGIWGVAPDVHNLFGGTRAEQLRVVHDSPAADVFFFHYTLDRPFFRELSIELTFLSLAALGVAFVLYDWRFGRREPAVRLFGNSNEPQDRTETENVSTRENP